MWTFSMENSELSLLCEILSEVDKLREFFIVSMFRSPSTRPHADATSIAFGCGEWGDSCNPRAPSMCVSTASVFFLSFKIVHPR